MRNKNDIVNEIDDFYGIIWFDEELIDISSILRETFNNIPQIPSSISDDSDKPKSSSPIN